MAESGISAKKLISRLNAIAPRYRSVAFEGAMYAKSLQGFWPMREFQKLVDKHGAQIAIGLGWAVAERDLHVSSYCSRVPKEHRTKVLDGMGFWYAMNQRRNTIRNQEYPAHLGLRQRLGFDRGVGRAVWYITNGKLDKILTIFSHFPDKRKGNLWQGIGIASTYVGGCTSDQVKELKIAAGPYRNRINKGIRQALLSMEEAQS